MLLLSSGEGTAVQSRPADCPSPPCTLQPLILSPRSNRAVVDPFKPYGPLPCVISVTACASRQGCVAAAINATVLVRPRTADAGGGGIRLMGLGLWEWECGRSRQCHLDKRHLNHSRLHYPTTASQPTPIASAGGPYSAPSPFPKTVLLNGTASECGSPPCTYMVRLHSAQIGMRAPWRVCCRVCHARTHAARQVGRTPPFTHLHHTDSGSHLALAFTVDRDVSNRASSQQDGPDALCASWPWPGCPPAPQRQHQVSRCAGAMVAYRACYVWGLAVHFAQRAPACFAFQKPPGDAPDALAMHASLNIQLHSGLGGDGQEQPECVRNNSPDRYALGCVVCQVA